MLQIFANINMGRRGIDADFGRMLHAIAESFDKGPCRVGIVVKAIGSIFVISRQALRNHAVKGRSSLVVSQVSQHFPPVEAQIDRPPQVTKTQGASGQGRKSRIEQKSEVFGIQIIGTKKLHLVVISGPEPPLLIEDQVLKAGIDIGNEVELPVHKLQKLHAFVCIKGDDHFIEKGQRLSVYFFEIGRIALQNECFAFFPAPQAKGARPDRVAPEIAAITINRLTGKHTAVLHGKYSEQGYKRTFQPDDKGAVIDCYKRIFVSHPVVEYPGPGRSCFGIDQASKAENKVSSPHLPALAAFKNGIVMKKDILAQMENIGAAAVEDLPAAGYRGQNAETGIKLEKTVVEVMHGPHVGLVAGKCRVETAYPVDHVVAKLPVTGGRFSFAAGKKTRNQENQQADLPPPCV